MRTMQFRSALTLLPFLITSSFVSSIFVSSTAHASLFATTLSGVNEVPANASTASGFATVDLNGNLLTVNVSWSGLAAASAAGHIHCCVLPGSNVGVAVAFTGLPAATSGTYTSIFDLANSTTYTTSFRNNFGGGTVAGAQAALIDGLKSGKAYVNLHDSSFPGGEIRGQLAQVPEPRSAVVLAMGLAGLLLLRRRRMRLR